MRAALLFYVAGSSRYKTSLIPYFESTVALKYCLKLHIQCCLRFSQRTVFVHKLNGKESGEKAEYAHSIKGKNALALVTYLSPPSFLLGESQPARGDEMTYHPVCSSEALPLDYSLHKPINIKLNISLILLQVHLALLQTLLPLYKIILNKGNWLHGITSKPIN